ncbi:MAG: 3-methyl-2-oxobutanoate hydroxymethyltransferase [Gammaproteobacteria bacterium]|nr:MAG: 3-methyl-2-oxobutanoate hydroxymethyltransferase [Pseudomonadota bacterium]PIE37922.1 MAG: 3-methyl-2-oxobutanoate hydroxymethyltransferase [Gammaproteobacteria bacterium]
MAININTLRQMKSRQEKFACLTAYDATFSNLASTAGVEVLLVGDSLGMVLQGHDSTVPVTMEDMIYHTRCVKNGNQDALIMADMPFMSYSTPEQAMENAGLLMQAGAHMVKLEGGEWLCETITMLSERGIPVCAHLGLTPQSVNKLGGYKVQGRGDEQAAQLIENSQILEQSGADIILVECIPGELATRLTATISAPVIGIGAGSDTDGQVLVMHDMLGVTPGKTARFVKNFMSEASSIQEAVTHYVQAVKTKSFPGAEHGFK